MGRLGAVNMNSRRLFSAKKQTLKRKALKYAKSSNDFQSLFKRNQLRKEFCTVLICHHFFWKIKKKNDFFDYSN